MCIPPYILSIRFLEGEGRGRSGGRGERRRGERREKRREGREEEGREEGERRERGGRSGGRGERRRGEGEAEGGERGGRKGEESNIKPHGDNSNLYLLFLVSSRPSLVHLSYLVEQGVRPLSFPAVLLTTGYHGNMGVAYKQWRTHSRYKRV